MPKQIRIIRTGTVLLLLLILVIGASCQQTWRCPADSGIAEQPGTDQPAAYIPANIETGSEEIPADSENNESQQAQLTERYQEYLHRLDAVTKSSEIPENGFEIVEDQIFPFTLTVTADSSGADSDPDTDITSLDSGEPAVYLIPAFDRESRRLALFFTDADGYIFYKTDQLETNYQLTGELSQPNESIEALSFQDLNGDSRTDIILVTACTSSGSASEKQYRIGDVLFQNEAQTGFYRDYRISDKINRFGMNKSTGEITAFVRDGASAEFMYTATTLDELQSHGMQIIEEQCYTRTFEKMGRLKVVPGTYKIANYDVFLIYLVDEQGYIVSSLQPMGDADNLYALKGIQCRDIDGDGLKDIVVLARYSFADADGQFTVKSDYSVYYQRTSGFSADTEIKNSCICSDEDTMEQLVAKLRAYWGWKSEQ